MAKKSNSPPILSLVVPVYNCQTIDRDLKKIYAACQKLTVPFELICVVDGQKNNDDQTLAKTEKLLQQWPHFKLIHYLENRGKGFALRTGFAVAQGNLIGFIDAGNDINPIGIGQAYNLIQAGADVSIGSKEHGLSQVNYPPLRKLYSKVLQLLTFYFFSLQLRDTQVGLKLFRRQKLLPLLPQLTINQWALDLELLALLKRQEPTIKITEFPIQISYNYSTNVKPAAALSFIIDFFTIFVRMKIYKLYDR